MCMICMILSPNCCTVTIFESSSTRCFTKQMQSADLDLLKLAKKRKIVWAALLLGKVCIWSDKISNVSAILGQKSTARLKVNRNTRSPPLSENLKQGFKI